jgi:hypothetical protein
MMPEEWPIAAPAADRNAPARDAGRGRLRTVRTDFFLNPAERLTEQERALMTAMLHCLVGDLATELRAHLPAGWSGANDDAQVAIVEVLMRAGLLDDPELMALLLRRADEERIGTAARARSGRRDARVLQGLVSHHNSAVSGAAMALILARGRRRDRFGQCLLGFDDLPSSAAANLVHAIAAALRDEISAKAGPSEADRELTAAVSRLLAKREPARSIEALTARLVALTEADGGPADDLVLASAQEGEVGFLAEVLARRAGIPLATAIEEFLSGSPTRLAALLRTAGFARELSAGLLASIGDLIGIPDAGAAIAMFDRMTAEEVQTAVVWLGAPREYRAALEVLGGVSG